MLVTTVAITTVELQDVTVMEYVQTVREQTQNQPVSAEGALRENAVNFIHVYAQKMVDAWVQGHLDSPVFVMMVILEPTVRIRFLLRVIQLTVAVMGSVWNKAVLLHATVTQALLVDYVRQR